MRLILLLLAAAILSGCSTQLTKLAKYETADVDAAIAIATQANDTARLACYNAIKEQLGLQAMVRGLLSQDEALRVAVLRLGMACSNL